MAQNLIKAIIGAGGKELQFSGFRPSLLLKITQKSLLHNIFYIVL